MHAHGGLLTAIISGKEALGEILKAYDVKYVFGMPSSPLADAVYGVKEHVNYVMFRDEKCAAHAADGYARVSYKPGVCMALRGPGATNFVTAIAEAYYSSTPVIAITDQARTDEIGLSLNQEIDQLSLFSSITKWNVLVDPPKRLPEMLRKAFRIATSGRTGPVHLDIPYNALDEKTNMEVYAEKEYISYPATRTRPDPGQIVKAIPLLLRAERPVMMVGQGVMISQAWDEVTELAELLAIPVATTFSSKGAIPENHPLSIGFGGYYGRSCTNRILEDVDLALVVGCNLGVTVTNHWHSPPPGTKIIHIDIVPEEIGRNYSTEVGIVGDAKLALRDLIEALKLKIRKKPLEQMPRVQQIQNLLKDWWDAVAPRMSSDEVPIKPQRLIKEIQEFLDKNAILVSDVSTADICAQHCYKFLSPGRRFLNSSGIGAMGYGFSAAIGAKLALGQNQSLLCLTGDGGFSAVIQELETALRNNVIFTTVVFDNKALGAIKFVQKYLCGERYIASDFLDTNYGDIAKAFGCWGTRVERPGEIREALKNAYESGKPAVIDVMTDPEEYLEIEGWIARRNRESRTP
jgi:acetolactate synthase-1/2/3 large subunit